jgi:hypothetical protein
MDKAKALFLVVVLIVSQISFGRDIAFAVTGTFNCGTSGTYTVIDGVLQGNNNTCKGALVLDSSVTRINSSTRFYATPSNITSVSIPATTTSISTNPFGTDAKNLTEYIVDPDNPNYSSQDGVLYNKNKTELIRFPYGKTGASFTIPDSVTTISTYGFYCLVNLQTVNIGANVTSMDNAFNIDCTPSSIAEIVIDPNNPNYSSQDGVFFNKNKTTLLIYPYGKNGTNYSVPSSVTTIRSSAFERNPFLESLTLPNGLTRIGTYAFYLTKLTSITIPDSVTTLDNYVFTSARQLESINVGVGNSNYKSVGGVLYSKDGKTLISYPDGKTDPSFEIPSGVESVSSQWTANGFRLLRITVPSSVTSFGSAWSGNDNKVGSYMVFLGNSNLTSISSNYANKIIYCGNANTALSNWATAQSKTIICQSQAPDFVLSSDTLSGVKSTSFTGYTISSNVASDYYSISPTLSSGLTFSTTTGLISGTPSVVATATNYTVTGFNGIGSTARTLTLTINERAPAFTLSRSSLTRVVGSSGSYYSISSSGGTITSYSISPEISSTPGLSFSTSTGLITGTPTQEAAVQTYTITATNAGGNATRTFALTVAAAVPAFTLSPTSQTKAVGSSTSFYSITSTGGAITSYSISPAITNTPGLSFSTSTGLISGTPTEVASPRTYTITATNAGGTASQTFAITVIPAAPVYTAEELAAQAAAQKAAEELAALEAKLELRRQQIEAAKVVITDLLKSSKAISINQFQEAMYQPVSPKIIDRLNIEILKLPIELRLVEKEINSLIDALTFDQAFYDVKDRPTVDTYNLYGIPGMTARILSSVNDSILLIPSAKKTDLSVIRGIVLKYATVDQISNPLTKKSVTADQLVRIGLISVDNKNKTTILNVLKRTPGTQIDTYEKLQSAISVEMALIKARADRLAAIKQKIRT